MHEQYLQAQKMKLSTILSIFLFISIFSITTRAHHVNRRGGLPLPDYLLRPDHPAKGTSCANWRFGVETNNVRDWSPAPSSCKDYLGNYMLGEEYRKDSITVISEAIAYAKTVEVKGDGKDVWVFDIDDTAVSTLPYVSQAGFGADEFNSTSYEEWEAEGSAPALPGTLKLYHKLGALGIKAVFITGRKERPALRSSTEKNLINAGYKTWEKLILKPISLTGSRVSYKSGVRQKLVEEGYRIVGNIGDQWGDLLGSPEGDRTFKLPNPMYYSG